jgi:hypothetical protein
MVADLKNSARDHDGFKMRVDSPRHLGGTGPPRATAQR